MDIEETALPGIGLRHDFLTQAGRRVGVVSHRHGRRDLVVYSERDPDAAEAVMVLAGEEADALAELLGAPRIVQRLTRLQEQAAGLVTELIPIAPGSAFDSKTIADTRTRTRTGASIVAITRPGEIIPSPTPDFRLMAGDAMVTVGTQEGLARVRSLVAGSTLDDGR